MKYGLACKICERLLWVGDTRPKAGDPVPPAGWVHAASRKPRQLHEQVQWCQCKGQLHYVDVQEPR